MGKNAHFSHNCVTFVLTRSQLQFFQTIISLIMVHHVYFQPNLYPNMIPNDKCEQKTLLKREGRKVRALYDFEAAEENEITFFTGEVLYVRDDSDPNWWVGYNDRGEGLFPSNFVTDDLNVIDQNNFNIKSRIAPKNEDKIDKLKIDEIKIDRLLFLIHEANPEDPSQVKNFSINSYCIIFYYNSRL